jgi:hypothetical protein
VISPEGGGCELLELLELEEDPLEEEPPQALIKTMSKIVGKIRTGAKEPAQL